MKYFEGFPHTLDYGLYFFGPDGAYQKYVAGQANPYCLEHRKTLIYVHGWEADRIEHSFRETFHWSSNEPRFGLDLDLAPPWLDRNWNVGIFYWDQFSDEPWLPDAEAKIWNAQGPRSMRYRVASGDFQASSVRGSASELLAAQLLSLPEGMELRLAGHSLGSPLVIAAAEEMLKRRPEAFGIRRIALLDPYWSRQMPLLNPQDYLPLKTTAEESLERAQKLADRQVLFEIYYSCPVLTQLPLLADDSPARHLLSSQMAVMVCYDASFAELDLEAQHLLAPCLYLHSMRFAAGPVPSARSSTAQLRSSLGRCF